MSRRALLTNSFAFAAATWPRHGRGATRYPQVHLHHMWIDAARQQFAGEIVVGRDLLVI
jgi:hypothetical protein